jgi:hypothetical protein
MVPGKGGPLVIRVAAKPPSASVHSSHPGTETLNRRAERMNVEPLALSSKIRSSGREPGNHQLRGDVVRLILVGFAYFALASLGLQLASINPSATPIWPPTGLAIAAILLWGYRVAPAIFVAAFLVNQLTAGSIFTSSAIAFGNTLEAVIAGYLVRYWADGDQVFDTPIGIAT